MIQIIDGFNLQTSTPIDSRIVVANDTERLAITSTYPGLRIWQVDTNTPYFWDESTGSPAWKSELDLVVTGDGTNDFIPKFTSSDPTKIGDSQISDDGSLVTIFADLKVNGDLDFDTLSGNLSADRITTGEMSLERLYVGGGNADDVLRLVPDGTGLVPEWVDITGISIGTSDVSKQVLLEKVNSSFTSKYSFVVRDVNTSLSASGATPMDLYTYITDLIINEGSGKMCILAHNGSKENPPYSFYDTTSTGTPTITGGMYHDGDRLVLSNRNNLSNLVDMLVIDKEAVTFGSYVNYSPRIRTHQDPTDSNKPSYTWWGNDKTGMYRPSHDEIGFSIDGDVKMKIDNNGVSIKTSQYDNPDANKEPIVFNNINSIGVPIGGIIIWSGDYSDIGTGNLWNFAECNGTSTPSKRTNPDGIDIDVVWSGSNLPNLSGRFALGNNEGAGFGQYEVGVTGGESTTPISESNLPKHRHFVNLRTGSATAENLEEASENMQRTNDGAHDHTIIADDAGASGEDLPKWGNASSTRDLTESILNDGAHSHQVLGYTDEAGGDSSPENLNNMPPYLVVTYIIRLV